MEILNSGFMYLAKRDKRYRPVMVVNCAVMKKFSDKDIEDLAPCVEHLLTFMQANVCVKGKADTMTLIIDLNGLGMTEIPIKALKGFINSSQTRFRGSLFRQYMVNASGMVKMSFNVFKMMVDEFSREKMSMFGKDEYQKTLLSIIDRKNLERKFGGDLPDISGTFFPPDMSIQGEEMV